MGYCSGECIGGMVRLWNFSKPQKQLYILLDMLFFSFSRAYNALLYRERRIFHKRNGVLCEAQRNNSPCLCNGKTRRYTLRLVNIPTEECEELAKQLTLFAASNVDKKQTDGENWIVHLCFSLVCIAVTGAICIFSDGVDGRIIIALVLSLLGFVYSLVKCLTQKR